MKLRGILILILSCRGRGCDRKKMEMHHKVGRDYLCDFFFPSYILAICWKHVMRNDTTKIRTFALISGDLSFE